jgi:hypothetical protein
LLTSWAAHRRYPDVLKGRWLSALEAVASSEAAAGGRHGRFPGEITQETGLERSPDARTRQIQIRNRQQDLHTARPGAWQVFVGVPGHLKPIGFGGSAPPRVDFAPGIAHGGVGGRAGVTFAG